MIKAVIVDDEDRAREVMKSMIGLYCPYIQVIGEASGVEKGFNAITALRPDVVFLDIQMPDGTGFDLLNRFPTLFFKFFIVTAYHEYAVKAFRYSAIDYILKPIDPVELMSATLRLQEAHHDNDLDTTLRVFHENTRTPGIAPQKVVLKTVDSVLVMEIDHVIRCESQNNYTLFHCIDRDHVLVSKTLKEFEEMLSPTFVRIHQSHLVNLHHIVKYSRYPDSHVLLSNDEVIPVAVRKRDILNRLLKGRK